jgi:amidohydrolase
MDTSYVRQQCQSMNDRLIGWRRALHRIPEIGFELIETEAWVGGVLRELGIPLQEGYQGAGLIGLVAGGKGPGPTVAIRADMDALEIEEAEGRDCRSQHPGKMHACGHDAHTAMVLGAAEFLMRHRDEWGGTLKLLFQPAEETMGGAQQMIQSGALKDPPVDLLLGLHIGEIWGEVGPGQVGVSYRPMMAATDSFNFTMKAAGGHGAAPQLSADPVLAAAAAICQLHTLVSRCTDPCEPAVISVGEIHGGRARNIIPTEVSIRGTVRTLSEGLRDLLEARIRETLEHTAEAHRCGYEFAYFRNTPVLANDPRANDLVARAAGDLLGPEEVRLIERPTMGGEDMAFFLREVPGCFFGLGAGNPEKGIRCLHHSPSFEIDESVLWRGTAVFCLAALRAFAGEFRPVGGGAEAGAVHGPENLA